MARATACGVAGSGSSYNLMATTLAPVDSREVVRCDHCCLVQFRTMNNLCRKCRTSLDEEVPEPVVVAAPPPVEETHNGHRRFQIALAIRTLRHRGGLSQRQLALRMQVPRTYVSKIENDKATPTLSSLERLANALQVTVSDLLRSCGRTHDDKVRELLSDEFISELAPFVCKLDPMQRQTFLTQVRELTSRPRRNA